MHCKPITYFTSCLYWRRIFFFSYFSTHNFRF